MNIEPMRFARKQLTPDMQRILRHFALADWQAPFPQIEEEVDWEKLFQAVVQNGLLTIAHYYFSKNTAHECVPDSFLQMIRRIAMAKSMGIALQYKRVVPVLDILNQRNIDYIVVKGPAVGTTIYENRNLRPFGDLDIIIRERDWSITHETMLSLGYEQVDDDGNTTNIAAPVPKFVPEVIIYELKYWNPKLQFMVEVHLDDILNAGLTTRDIDGFWARLRTIEVDGVSMPVMSMEDQLLHLCMHIHYHGFNRLNSLTDIALVIRDHSHELDWQKFLHTTQGEEAEVGAYYTLYYVQQLLGIFAPTFVMDTLRPDKFRQWWHEKLMPSEKIISLEPMWRPDFSFYFLPLYKRLLPDLLVMGRRREKLHVLARLLNPPAEWLRYYYHVEPHKPLWPHYLFHPLKLIYHYLEETVYLLKGQYTEFEPVEDD